jgi:beta-carotene 15,15'-dioxygenase
LAYAVHLGIAPTRSVTPDETSRGRCLRAVHRHCVISFLVFLMLLQTYIGAVDILRTPVVAAFLIIVLGAPHGALDVAIASHRQQLTSTRQIAVFLCKYVALAAFVLMAWWLAPALSLAAFLLLSAYHFGGDWTPSAFKGARFVLGAAILSATTLVHSAQVALIFAWLAPPVAASGIAAVMAACCPILLVAAIVIAAHMAVTESESAVEFFVVLAGAVILPPITFFVAYFCFLHSVRHLFDVQSELPQHDTRKLITAGWRYAALAILGSFVGALAFAHMDAGPAVLSSVFVTLAALTVPHIVLIDWARTPQAGPMPRAVRKL